MITRSEWGARTPKGRNPNTDKTGGIVVHWTGSTTAVKSHWPGCWERWRAHQNYHMDTKGWLDIAYNQLVCPHGFHFEGRGWDTQNGANLPENPSTLSICVEGGPGYPKLEPAAAATVNLLIGEAVSRGWARRVRGHREVSATGTQCPGYLQPLIVDGRIGLTPIVPTPPPPPTTGTAVMGPAQVSVGQAEGFIVPRTAGSPHPATTIRQIIQATWRISESEGVRADLAIGLMCKETGFFQYGGSVKADQWNFGGIGSTGVGVPGLSFPNPEAGVHAVVRRMRMYAAGTAQLHDLAILGRGLPEHGVVDPGFKGWGKHPNIEDFNGVWADPGPNYGQSIVAMVELMKQVPTPTPPAAPFTDTEIVWLDGRYVRRSE